jgi:intracellular septation protein
MQIEIQHRGTAARLASGEQAKARLGKFLDRDENHSKISAISSRTGLSAAKSMKKLLFDLFPIIIFFIAYKLGDAYPEATRDLLMSLGLPQTGGADDKPGIYLATLVAIVASVGQILWVKLSGQKTETMMWVSLGIIVVFGGATLILHDETFIKWKPTVLYWVFAAIIFGAALMGKNVIKNLMAKQMELPDEAWGRLNASWGGFFAFMGVANLLVAFNFSTDAWVNFKLFGSLGLMLVFVVWQSMMLNKYLDKEAQK